MCVVASFKIICVVLFPCSVYVFFSLCPSPKISLPPSTFATMETSFSEYSVESKWDRCIDKLNLNNVHKKRKCFVVLVVEKTASDLEKLLMIRYHSESNVKNEVKFISLNDVYDFIISYETKRLFVHAPVKTMLRKSCQEARNYLRKGSTLPHGLLAKIIKLRVVTLITNDVHQHKYPKIQCDDSSTPQNYFDSLPKRNQERANRLLFRKIYVVLIQFYSPKIIQACYQCGLPISAIVEFGEKCDKTTLETPPIRQSDVFRQEFWKKAPALYYEHHLEEPFRLVYNTKQLQISKDNPKTYAQQCLRLYKGFVKSIDIDRIKELKDALIHHFNLRQKLLNAPRVEVDRDQDAEEDIEDEGGEDTESEKRHNTYVSLSSVTSDSGWEDTKPFVRRVLPELDIDSRKRYTVWPSDGL